MIAPLSHRRIAASRNGSAFALNVWKTRSTPRSVSPRSRSSGMSAAVFGVSIGPKQP